MLLGFVVLALPFIVVVAAIIYIPWFLYTKQHYGKQTWMHHFVRYVFVGYVLSLVYLTILWYYPDITFKPDYYFLNLRPFIWVNEVYDMGVRRMMSQLLLNIGMFVPLGLLLPIVFKVMGKFWKTAAAALGTTFIIETLQYFMGRSADIDDVIMNFVGGVIGYLVFILFRRLWGRRNWWENMTEYKTAD